MTRAWVDDAKKHPVDKRWVMRCDVGFWSGRRRCDTESEPQRTQPDLAAFVLEGWFISAQYDDICPPCLAEGVLPSSAPHRLWSRWNEKETVTS